MTTRTWTVLASAIGFSLGLFACSSSSEDTPAAGGATSSAAGTSTGGTSAGGTANGGTSAGGAANGGGGSSAGGGGAGGTSAGACPSLMPSGTPHKLIISKIVPGLGIEAFNPGAAAVMVKQVWFCSQFDYKRGGDAASTDTIPPGSYHLFPWPMGSGYDLTTTAGGELLMMINDDGFPTADSTQSYVCWGDHAGGRKDDATVGVDLLYTGPCAPALTDAIARKPATTGTDAASYDTAADAMFHQCP